jgi:quercetin dioxygenase-like cupin family protein
MKAVLVFSILLTVSTSASAQDPVKVDPAHYRVMFENAHMRVLEYRDKPGDKAPMHSHPAYMTYVTGTGRVKDTLPNGDSRVDEIAGSEFDCLPPTTHAGQNVGNTPIQELLVEFKDANNPCSGTEQALAFGNRPSRSRAVRLKMPGPEVQNLMLGTWSIKVQYGPAGDMPSGTGGKGTEVGRAGRGGRSVTEEYHEKNPKGVIDAFGPVW